jgi:intracellular multiplication protein IcmQ
MMSDQHDKDEHVTEELLAILSNLLDSGNWDASLFLKVSKKRLLALREEAQALLSDLQTASLSEEKQPAVHKKAGQCSIYMGLHLGGAVQMARWEHMLQTLSAYSVGRPVYAEEAHAKAALHAKLGRENDAYVEIVIDETAILPVPEDKMPKDRLQQPLLTLKMGAIYAENIARFVCSGHTYRFIRGRLVLLKDD